MPDVLAIDVDRQGFRVDGVFVRLRPEEYDLASILWFADGGLVTHDKIVRGVWGSYADVEPQNARKVIHVLVNRLRGKLGRTAIETVWGRGYRIDRVANGGAMRYESQGR